MRTGASREEVRRAYRDLARRLHPDRHGQASNAERAFAGRRMRDVNRAWQVLSDDDRRRRYDESLRPEPSARRAGAAVTGAATASGPSVSEDDELVDVMGEVGPLGAMLMRHLPWLVAVVMLVGIVVVSAYATAGRTGSDGKPLRTPAQSVGACVTVDPGPVTRTVTCTAPGALRLVARVPAGSPCPAGAEPRRLDNGGFTDCLASPSSPSFPAPR